MHNNSALPARVFIETEADAARFWQIGILWRLMASGIKTGNTLCVLDELVGGEAGGPVTHAHPAEEGFYVIDGRCKFYAGGKTIDARAGTFVAIPRYTPHAFLAEPGSRLLNWYLPAGFELLLLGLALPAERNEAPPPPPPGGEKLSEDYGQIPIMGLPFADPPDPEKMKTEPLVGAAALPFSSDFDTAPAYWSAGALWTVLADGTSTGGMYSLFEELCPAGLTAPPHVHSWSDEAFYVLEGEVEFVAGGLRQTAGEGSFVFIPRGTVHSFKVRSVSARFLNLYTEPGIERFLVLGGEKTDRRTLPPAGWTPPGISAPRQQQLFAEIGMHPVALPNPFA
jgi:quercetin dioxygenase-like cupin family protein